MYNVKMYNVKKGRVPEKVDRRTPGGRRCAEMTFVVGCILFGFFFFKALFRASK